MPSCCSLRSCLVSAGRACPWTWPWSGRRAEVYTHWCNNVAVMIRQSKVCWVCVFYAVTFDGFVGFCSILPLFFHEQYHEDGIAVDSIAALCGVVGRLVRPLGGYAADRI